MLDLGFVKDIQKIAKLVPETRHTMLFSATMPREIAGLAGSMLRDPQRIEVTPTSTPVERIDQSVLFVDKARKLALLAAMTSSTSRVMTRRVIS